MKTKQRLEEEKLLIQKKLEMAKAYKVKKEKVISAGSDSMFFRGEHPDKRSPKEWVKYMNKKYGLKWNGRD